MKQMTKKKFISSIVAYAFLFVLLSCLVGYGAWAILNANFNLGGNISFEANNVLATISAGQVSGGTLTDEESKLQQITIDLNNNGQTAMQTWSGLDLHFNDNADDVTITFTITNNHTEKALLVEVGEITGTKTNADVSVTADGGSASSVVIAPSDNAQFVVTFSVSDKSQSASITGFSIPISMENYEEPEGYAVTITGGNFSYALDGQEEIQQSSPGTPITVQNKILIVLTELYDDTFINWDATINEIQMFSRYSDMTGPGSSMTFTVKVNTEEIDTYTTDSKQMDLMAGYYGIILEITEPSTIEITSENNGEPSIG